MVILSSKKNTKIKYKNKKDSNQSNMPMWRNWQTHWIQNPAGNHVGSSPTIGTNDVSALTNKIDKYKNQSIKWLIFSFSKNHRRIYNESTKTENT